MNRRTFFQKCLGLAAVGTGAAVAIPEADAHEPDIFSVPVSLGWGGWQPILRSYLNTTNVPTHIGEDIFMPGEGALFQWRPGFGIWVIIEDYRHRPRRRRPPRPRQPQPPPPHHHHPHSPHHPHHHRPC